MAAIAFRLIAATAPALLLAQFAGCASKPVEHVAPRTSTCIGVSVPAGASIQSDIADHPGDTTFCLAPATWNVTVPLKPLSGDSFVGVSGSTVLDGENSTEYAFNAITSDYSVSDLEIEHFTVDGIDLYNDSTVNDVDVFENASGVWMHGNDDLVENSNIQDNGYIHVNGVSSSFGIGSDDASNGQVLDNVIYDNNSGCNPTAQQGGGASASKFWLSTSMLLQGNHWHNNYGNAIWLDGSSSDFIIKDETIVDNTNMCPYNGNTIDIGGSEGIRLEVSCDSSVMGNLVNSNGNSDGGGIDMAASYGNTVTDNSITVGGGGFGIRVMGQDRTMPFGGYYSPSSQCGTGVDNANGNSVTGNTMTTSSDTQYNGVIGVSEPVTGTIWTGNSYVTPSCTNRVWKWWTGTDEETVPWTTWQATYGLDTSGGCQT